MISLGNNISTSSTPESKYSLDLDGTGDYLDIGTGIDLGTGDFSISAWVKLPEATSINLLSKFESAGDRWFIRTQGADKIQFLANVGSSTIMDISYSGDALSEDEWHHIVVTCDRSESDGLKIYVDNSVGTAGAGSTTDIDNDGNLFFGRQNSSYSVMTLDEVAIWNVVLDEEAVAVIYNNGSPTNLTFDSSDYDNSSALQGYWRMGNGLFDDKANGVVHDQVNPGLGSELVSNGNFDNLGVGDFTASEGSLAQVSNELILTTTTTVDNAINYNITLSTGSTYEATLSFNEAGSSTNKWALHCGSYLNGTNNREVQAYGIHTVTFVATDANLSIQTYGAGAIATYSFDNVSVKKLNDNPGITSGNPTFSSDAP